MITDEVAPLRHDVEPWFMSGFAFRCAWEALGLDRLPSPLSYRHRGPKYMSEVEADRREALAQLRASLTPNRVRILEALRYPAYLLQGFGQIEGGQIYRLLGVIGTTGYCAVITQDPSEQLIFGGDVQIIGCVNIDFPQVVLEALPAYKPGTRPRKEELLEDETPTSALRDAKITAQILLSGSAEFTRDYQLRDATHLTVINIADDGAYLVNEGEKSFQIIPATVANLMQVFQKIEKRQSEALADKLAAEQADRDFDAVP
ncbi:ESX secretion-associated protein EspG [Mycolicibacterium sp. HK-90]|uniref:ESX secretion-associated protein EspG n=1 Tax=Mycolicibacterium sp. HK-90 TaxID=3056937 RepID=UPI002657FFAA|nr:ESX secretion-associated protein EspG [Mycolicibacterium sp. HK-90]WKG03105.1 ESX secretion-associated protein EspG [Mycolicibacterium sp. HK-90]